MLDVTLLSLLLPVLVPLLSLRPQYGKDFIQRPSRPPQNATELDYMVFVNPFIGTGESLLLPWLAFTLLLPLLLTRERGSDVVVSEDDDRNINVLCMFSRVY